MRAGVDKHCAKVLFALSQISVADELRRRQRAVSLQFFDMVEVRVRLRVPMPVARPSLPMAAAAAPFL